LLARARAVTLTNYCDVARHVGLDPYAMLGRAGLHPSALRDPENWVPAHRILKLLEESAAQSGRDDFGILLGECRTFASLGPVSLLLKQEARLGDIISTMIDHRSLLNELLHLELRTERRSTILEWALIPGLNSSQGVNLLATIAYRVLVDGAGISWQPECIHFRHASPKCLDTFKRVFRCPLEFGSNFDGLSCSSACLDLPNAFADPDLAAHARRLLSLMPGLRKEDTMSDRARSAIPFLMSGGQAQAEDLAKCQGVSVRTLQRHLVNDGQSFRGLLRDARRDLAVRYLADPSRSITSVALSTGFSTLSSFSRWFVSEFGMAPGKWRKLMKQRDALHIQQPINEARADLQRA